VARAQGDTAGAQSLYKRALGVNPSYLPALIGLADVQWDGGDKAGAQKAYRDIVDRFPEPAYPARVKQRADSGGGGGAPASSE
jgi:Tfp pilus assembly protein PilF